MTGQIDHAAETMAADGPVVVAVPLSRSTTLLSLNHSLGVVVALGLASACGALGALYFAHRLVEGLRPDGLYAACVIVLVHAGYVVFAGYPLTNMKERSAALALGAVAALVFGLTALGHAFLILLPVVAYVFAIRLILTALPLHPDVVLATGRFCVAAILGLVVTCVAVATIATLIALIL